MVVGKTFEEVVSNKNQDVFMPLGGHLGRLSSQLFLSCQVGLCAMVWLLAQGLACLEVLRTSGVTGEAFGGGQDGWRSKYFALTGGFFLDILPAHFLCEGWGGADLI